MISDNASNQAVLHSAACTQTDTAMIGEEVVELKSHQLELVGGGDEGSGLIKIPK